MLIEIQSWIKPEGNCRSSHWELFCKIDALQILKNASEGLHFLVGLKAATEILQQISCFHTSFFYSIFCLIASVGRIHFVDGLFEHKFLSISANKTRF